MKKLSIEEKAKAYDKKLAEAKEMLIDGGISQNTIDCIQKLYPELKCSTDSEDERIINNIRKVIRWYRGIFTEKSLMPEQYQEINTWLEKQSNSQLPTFTFDDVLALQCCMETVKKVQEDKELYRQLQSLHSRLYDAYWIEKQGEQNLANSCKTCKDEQKPAETEKGAKGNVRKIPNSVWSEEDEEIHRKCICVMRASACGFPEEEKFVEQVDNWLKSLKDRVQPKQEWSEEDENLLKLSIENLTELKDRFGEEYGKVGDCIVWHESLKDRVGCEVNCATTKEWSEEDEKIVNLILCICSDFKKVYSQSETALKDADKIESFLKSLKDRYTWKPSDEQMKALEGIKDYVALTSSYRRKTMTEIIEQLKQL